MDLLPKATLRKVINIRRRSIRRNNRVILQPDRMDLIMSIKDKLTIKMTESVLSVPLPMMIRTTRILILLSLHTRTHGPVIVRMTRAQIPGIAIATHPIPQI